MAGNFNSDEQEWQSKGKCVIIEHHIFDELWNIGDKRIPEGTELETEDGDEDGEEQVEKKEEVKKGQDKK
jgi:translation initiation factor 1 (eIF-1/SUI1)